MNNHFISCDWGSSHLRLRLVDLKDKGILGEIVSVYGVINTFQAWESTNMTVARGDFFRGRLAGQLSILSGQTSISLHGLQVVVSGMASSSIGMEELEYAPVPFSLDGNDLIVKHYDPDKSFPNPLVLISGVKTENNAMRGEETQLLGIAGEVMMPTDDTTAIYIFPGTHSKHLTITLHQLVKMETHMTGELFSMLSGQTILKDSVNIEAMGADNDHYRHAFNRGVLEACANGIMSRLFTVRTNQLFHKMSKEENAFYLSGLLIGAELSALTLASDSIFVLCSGQNLARHYSWALETLGLSDRVQTVPAQLVENASVLGQIKLLSGLKKI